MALTPADLDAIVFDFDGVLTDNRVFVDTKGREMVACSRADGMGFDMLRQTKLKLFILTTEKNDVVVKRAKKLRVRLLQGLKDKRAALRELSDREEFSLERTLYVGNDYNDYQVMGICGHTACPADAHPAIRAIATHHLPVGGGQGVVRAVVEGVLGLDPLKDFDLYRK